MDALAGILVKLISRTTIIKSIIMVERTMPIKNEIVKIKSIQSQPHIGITNELKFIRNEKEPSKVKIEWRDSELLALYASIQLYEYKKNPDFPHGSPFDNFIGLIGELSVREIFERNGIQAEYSKRKLNYWGDEPDRKTDQRPYDFKLNDGKTIEIITLKPRAYFAQIKDTAWKKSDYTIAVKINRLRCIVEVFYENKYQFFQMNAERENPEPISNYKERTVKESESIGEAEIIGYDTLENIQKAPTTPTNQKIIEPNSGWFYSALNQRLKGIDGYDGGSITPTAAARCIRIKPKSQLPNIENLWKEIK
jgi:hypothetical protein